MNRMNKDLTIAGTYSVVNISDSRSEKSVYSGFYGNHLRRRFRFKFRAFKMVDSTNLSVKWDNVVTFG